MKLKDIKNYWELFCDYNGITYKSENDFNDHNFVMRMQQASKTFINIYCFFINNMDILGGDVEYALHIGNKDHSFVEFSIYVNGNLITTEPMYYKVSTNCDFIMTKSFFGKYLSRRWVDSDVFFKYIQLYSRYKDFYYTGKGFEKTKLISPIIGIYDTNTYIIKMQKWSNNIPGNIDYEGFIKES